MSDRPDIEQKRKMSNLVLTPEQLAEYELRATMAERRRIANRLQEEGDLAPCKEDGAVLRGAAWLVRADFSYEEAERLEVAAESIANGEQQLTGEERGRHEHS